MGNSDTATTNTTPIAQPRLNQISGQSSDLHSHSIPEDLEVERIMTSYRQHNNKPILPKSSTLMIPHNNQNYSRNLPNSTSMNCSATYIRPQITSDPQNLTSNSQPIIENIYNNPNNSSRNILQTFDKKNSRFERGVPKIDLSSGGITIVNESVDNL